MRLTGKNLEVMRFRYLGVETAANRTIGAAVSHRDGRGKGPGSTEECMERVVIIWEGKDGHI